MKRHGLSLGSALTVLAIALPVSALAPSDQYEKYASGDPTIVDAQTHLEWDRHPNPNTDSSKVVYPAAVAFAAAKASCGPDRRLPSLKKLLTIVDEAPYRKYVDTKNEDRYIDQNAFDNTPSGGFWTSSMVDANSAYTVDFLTGLVGSAQTGGGTPDTRYVRCVK